MVDEPGPLGEWKPDPFGRYSQRWWTGVEWTDQVVSPEGAVVIDPLGNAPGAAAGAAPQLPPPSPQFPAPPQPGVMPPPAYGGVPQHYAAPTTSKTSGIAIASMILGIGAFFFALVPFFGFASVPFAVVGLALGVVGVSRARKGGEGKGMSIAGIVTSVLALVISVLYVILFIAVADDTDGINSDPRNGICNQDRFLQDPDC